MSRPIRYQHEAREDLDLIYQKYLVEDPKKAARFLIRYEQLMLTIQGSPFLFGRVFQSVRAVTVKRFPYIVYYCVKRDRIEILAVCHKREEDRIKKLRR